MFFVDYPRLTMIKSAKISQVWIEPMDSRAWSPSSKPSNSPRAPAARGGWEILLWIHGYNYGNNYGSHHYLHMFIIINY